MVMNKSLAFFLWVVVLFVVVAPLHAQTGCDDSPENPTVLLAVVGGIGALVAKFRNSRRR